MPETNPYLDRKNYIAGPEFYRSDVGRRFLSQTAGGKFAFVWEAEYYDGQVFHQFETLAHQRALTDADYVPSEAAMMSTDALDRLMTSGFALRATALTKSVIPANDFEVRINLEEGDQLLVYWLVDKTPRTGVFIYRHVLGIRFANGGKLLTIVSPSGAVKKCEDDNQSYEGE